MAIEPWDAGAPPGSSQLAVGACFVLVALFFGIRAHLFGDVWHVNRTDGSAPTLQHTWRAAVSALPWWHGLTRETPAAAMLYLALLPAALVLIAASTRGLHGRLSVALIGASAGLVVATLLNLGGMSPSGEGGRLGYAPVAWLVLAFGVAGATAKAQAAAPARFARLASAGRATLVGATIAGGARR